MSQKPVIPLLWYVDELEDIHLVFEHVQLTEDAHQAGVANDVRILLTHLYSSEVRHHADEYIRVRTNQNDRTVGKLFYMHGYRTVFLNTQKEARNDAKERAK